MARLTFSLAPRRVLGAIQPNQWIMQLVDGLPEILQHSQ